MGIGGHRMSEIEKLYKNAGVKPQYKDYRTKNGKIYEDKNPNNRNIRLLYPPFTAEKQLSLIKWLLNNKNIGILKFEVINGKYEVYDTYYGCDKYRESLDEALADYICCLWQDLTESEREQIADIMKV